MPDTKRLVTKIDEAHRALKAERRRGDTHGSDLATALRERFATGRPFDVVIGGVSETIRCDGIRISRTTVTLPTRKCDGVIPLTRVTTCVHGRNDDGAEIHGFGLFEHDDSVTPIAFA